MRAGMLLGCVLAGAVLDIPMTFAQSVNTAAIVFPVMAPKLSSKYGQRRHPVYRAWRHHSGVDLAVPEDSHVRAVAGGIVVFAGIFAGYGKLITIKHAHGYTSLYGHLSDMHVNIGQTVPAGAIVGRVGSTGTATGPHLHFEWRKNGEAIDPLKVFPGLTIPAEG